MANNQTVAYATPAEVDDLTRSILIWLSAYPALPVQMVNPEPMLEAGKVGMMLTVIQSNITRRYITGGHMAEYQFGIIYRVQPTDPDERLITLEMLNRLGDYAVSTNPDLGRNIRVSKCEVTSQAALYATYDNSDEDYQILMKLTYEVF